MGDSAEKQKRPSFFKGAKAEFKKISWPDRQSTLKQSVAVVAISVVVGVITGFIVFLLVLVISALLPLVSLNASAIGTIAGILAAIVYFLSGKTLA